MSGKWFNVVCYGVNDEEDIDYVGLERLAHEHRPRLIIAGASAFARRIDFERIGAVAKAIAYFMVDMAHYAGLIAAGAYSNPVPVADFVTTTTHKNAIPKDPERPFVTSGIRLGSPAMTTRGFREDESRLVGHLIADVLDHAESAGRIAQAREQVAALTRRFPVYG